MSNKVKPIIVVGFPKKAAKHKTLERVEEDLKKRMPEYHRLFYSTFGDEFTFQCFYPSDFGSIEIEELKKIVMETINTNSND